jgi:hypothetical protein
MRGRNPINETNADALRASREDELREGK